MRELVIYIAQKCAPAQHFGAVKLNKILYHSDFRAFRKFGVPLTGAKYFRLKYGPAPLALRPIRRELEMEGAIRVEERQLGSRTQERVVALRDPVLAHFTADEIALVDEVIRDLWEQNWQEVSDASHDVIWRTLTDRDLIPYEAAFLDDEPPTDDEKQRTLELAAALGWDG